MKKLTTLWLTFLMTMASLTGCSPDEALSIGIIGGADGPTSILVSDGNNQSAIPDKNLPDADVPEDTVPEDGPEGTNDPPGNVEENFGPAVTGTENLIQGSVVIEEEGCYTSKEEVALYLMKYGMLPGNYITKKEAQSMGWEGGALDSYAPGKSIGGDYFGNYEGSLPEADGRSYQECDIDSGPDGRGAKRIVFSNDGLIFYTEDHYETFTLLTGG